MNNLDSFLWPVWGVLALVALVAIGFFVRAERRRFVAAGKAGSWLWVRLVSIPIALLSVALALLSARAVRGPEALAVFYGMLLTVVPVLYFSVHWLVGRLLTPSLNARESAAIAGSGLAMVIVPVMLAGMAQPLVYQLAQGMQQGVRDQATEAPLAHRLLDRRRWLLPELGEVVSEHWQAAPGIRVERIEKELGGQYLQAANSTGSIVCRDGEDLHVFRLAAGAAPRWRMYWRNAAGSLTRSEWTSSSPETPAQALAPVWTPDGFELPVRIPRSFVTVERRWPNGRVQNAEVLDPATFQSPAHTCLPLQYRNPDAESLVTGLTIRHWLAGPQRMGLARFNRPAD